jgi:hypothetical protein
MSQNSGILDLGGHVGFVAKIRQVGKRDWDDKLSGACPRLFIRPGADKINCRDHREQGLNKILRKTKQNRESDKKIYSRDRGVWG